MKMLMLMCLSIFRSFRSKLDPSFQGVNRLFVMAYYRVDGQPTRNGQK